jgi:hypothetical protein
MMIRAIERLSRLRGGSQPQLMLADDHNRYVVKFQGNPQTTRVLANDYLACRLARMVGLTVPRPVIIQVDEETIRQQQITFLLAGRPVAPTPGLQFGTRQVPDEQVFDWLPGELFGRVRNRREFAGMLAFDKWTGNADGRQAIFHKNPRQRRYTATFIDFGYCFNAGEWSFCDSPLRGIYARNDVYEHITSWEDFTPWLERIVQLPTEQMHELAGEIPVEWYGDAEELERLLRCLVERRSLVRGLIDDFRRSSRNPFPNWAPKLAPPPQSTAAADGFGSNARCKLLWPREWSSEHGTTNEISCKNQAGILPTTAGRGAEH